jgi:hypothetical protein
MNAASGALRPCGLVGRGSGYDFLRVDLRSPTRCGVGVCGRGSSQYGQRVDGSMDGSRNTGERLTAVCADGGSTYTNLQIARYRRSLMVP